jgi:hypothetical protein
MTPLLALALAAMAGASEVRQSTVAAPAAAVESEPPAGKVEASAQAPAKTAGVGTWVLGVSLVEGLFAAYSAAAAAWPQPVGWSQVVLAPLAVGMQNSADNWMVGAGFGAGVAGLGLYNALELRSSQYSRSERFWLNMAGWHAALGCGLITGWIFGPALPGEPKVAITVAPRPGGPLLLVSGRF